ncbi:hypothetical protein M0Q28_02300 [Patescibacteria group bacterium]|jgi:hypothetical protein|nr:hypothetical protein [Patescibacteria group bacterium]
MANNHVIGSGLTEQELQMASFWVRNRYLLGRIGHGTLAAIGIISWLYVFWSLLDAYAISYPREARIPTRILQNQLTVDGLNASAPKQITPSQISVFQATEKRLDFLVEIINPNTTWWAEFDYQFDNAGERTPVRKGYVLPSSKRYLTELGYESKSQNRTGRLIVENIQWHRVDPNAVGRDYAAFAAARLQFRIDEPTYTRDLTIGTQVVGQSQFTLVNESAYGYWNPEITVVLFRGGNPVAATTITRNDIRPGESVPMKVNWFENIAGISKSDIRVDVNILNPKAYLPTSGI